MNRNKSTRLFICKILIDRPDCQLLPVPFFHFGDIESKLVMDIISQLDCHLFAGHARECRLDLEWFGFFRKSVWSTALLPHAFVFIR